MKKTISLLILAIGFISISAGLYASSITVSNPGSPEIKGVDSTGTARLQVIHNSADAAAAVVDVWVNSVKLIPNFAFRTASPFIDAPAGVLLNIGIAPPNSTSWTQSLSIKQVVLTQNETYVVVANGIVSPTGYNPSPTFVLSVYPGAREIGTTAGSTDVLVIHGSTDAPVVDVLAGPATLIDNLAYGQIVGYYPVPAADLVLDIADETGSTILVSYLAPLATLGLANSAITVVASGFLDPSNNSNSPNTFGLWVALPIGGNLIPLPVDTSNVQTSTARLQVIHNSADAAAAVVDVWVDSIKLIPNFAFRTASPFVDAPAGVAFTIGIAPANSTSASQAIATFPVTLTANETYVVVANGIVSMTGYNPSPAFGLDVFPGAREMGTTAGSTDVLVIHGSTDAPVVDVLAGPATLIDNLAYGQFAGYYPVPAVDLVLDIADETGSTILVSYSAPLATLGLANSAITVVASGFLDPSNNSNSSNTFGLWVALPIGGNLIPLPLATTSVEEKETVKNIKIYPNPASSYLNFSFDLLEDAMVSAELIDMSGRLVDFKSTGSYGSGSNNGSFDLTELQNGIYILRLSGGSVVKNQRVVIQK